MNNQVNIFCLAVFTLLFTVNLNAQKWGKITGEGPIVKKELSLDKFNKIGLGVHGEVTLSKGNTQKVIIEGEENIINNIERDVDNGKWSIEFDDKVRNHKKLKIYITVPEVKGLSIAGSGEIISEDRFGKVDNMKMSIAGSGTIEFSGSSNELKVSIAGSGTVRAEEFQATNCKVSIAGSGDCYIDVDDRLEVSIAGSGDVRYKGSPSVKSSIAGSGNISSL